MTRPSGEAAVGHPSALPARRILVADDDLMTRKVLATVLDLEDYGVELVEDGHAALDAARAGGFDVVVLDHDMPGMTGLEVLAALRGDPTTAEVPVVLLTAVVAPSLDVDPIAAGADAFISKPFSPLHLVEVLDQLLGAD